MKPLLICMAIVLAVFALWPTLDKMSFGNVICLMVAGLCLLFAFIEDGKNFTEDGEKRGSS